MGLTFIDTNRIPRSSTKGEGEFAEILNGAICGAKNGVGSLRWLRAGERFSPSDSDKHQLIYVMEGNGEITLEGKSYGVDKGGGIYLAPTETATIAPASGGSLKLFHLVVPRIPK